MGMIVHPSRVAGGGPLDLHPTNRDANRVCHSFM